MIHSNFFSQDSHDMLFSPSLSGTLIDFPLCENLWGLFWLATESIWHMQASCGMAWKVLVSLSKSLQQPGKQWRHAGREQEHCDCQHKPCCLWLHCFSRQAAFLGFSPFSHFRCSGWNCSYLPCSRREVGEPVLLFSPFFAAESHRVVLQESRG